MPLWLPFERGHFSLFTLFDTFTHRGLEGKALKWFTYDLYGWNWFKAQTLCNINHIWKWKKSCIFPPTVKAFLDSRASITKNKFCSAACHYFVCLCWSGATINKPYLFSESALYLSVCKAKAHEVKERKCKYKFTCFQWRCSTSLVNKGHGPPFIVHVPHSTVVCMLMVSTIPCLCFVFQVEWIEQQVVKRRIKRDYKPAPPLSLSSPAHSSPAQNNIFYNDAKWSSMWYIVSTRHIRTGGVSLPLPLQHRNKGITMVQHN